MATTLPRAKKSPLRALLGRGPDRTAQQLAGPIRGELFGAERLAAHARALAQTQILLPRDQRRGAGPLLKRLHETQEILDDARAALASGAARATDISPAGVWLLDNYFIVEDHIYDIQSNLPAHFYRELPKLANGLLSGYPRVYELAIELIAHTEGHVNYDNIDLFVREFQRGPVLSMGELWAIPSMLRLGLIENIRRMSLRAMQRLSEVELADLWAVRLRDASADSNRALGDALAQFVQNHPPLTPTFVSHFLHQIRNYETDFTPLLWLEEWIAEDGLSVSDAVSRENQRIALTQVMMANSITSLRALTLVDWKKFFETQSATEAVLRQDPTGDYANMTFETRDGYRHVVERLAKGKRLVETEVASTAIELAQTEARAERERHVGYWLFDEGRRVLERRVGYRPHIRERLYRSTLRHPSGVYFGAIVLVNLLLLAVTISAVDAETTIGALAVLAFILLPANEIAVGVVNQIVTLFMPPRRLPRMEFREHGITAEYLSTVAIPTLFSGVDSVHDTIEHMEVQFLANRDRNLLFTVLSDFTDADTETTPEDATILDAAEAAIASLNAKYAATGSEIFFLLHRPRRWNDAQGTWLGWERKRGKLAEFNRFIRGGAQSAFMKVVGDVEQLRRVRYVLPLDSDTVLPREAAAVLVGTLAHPLNRAVYDPERQRVVKGYGILQPRISVSLPSAHRSLFAAIHSGHPGVDPYTTAVSDVYQDLYAEGSYTGKGIYDVDAFQQATKGRFPENTLLSHDLIEGTYARAALVTDLELYDDYPTRYLTFSARKDRWIRGDWQLLAWLGKTVPGPDGPTRNRLSTLSQWKIFDNMRRSLIELSQVALLLAGWFLLPVYAHGSFGSSPLTWTIIVIGAIAFPWLFSLLVALVRPPFGQSLRAYYAAVWGDAVSSAQQLGLYLVFLPHQAFISLRAIVRTFYRLFVTHRLLLEWRTASHVERETSSDAKMSWRLMMAAPVLAVATGFVVLARVLLANQPGASGSLILVTAALPVLLVWFLSPAIAHALGAPAIPGEVRLTPRERAHALRYAVLHWRYFSEFVTAETQWLAPDNFQDDPKPVVAARTSPTNMGLQLLSTISAADLGFITRTDMIERVELIFLSLERMRRFRGHFYNWYDLADLHVLEPAYISTVDSGNLAGAFLALKQACLAICDQSVRTSAVTEVMAMAERLAANRGGAHWHEWAAALAQRHHTETTALGLAGSQEDIIGSRTLRELACQAPAAAEQIARLEKLADSAQSYVNEMDFRFLFDDARKLFSIGYREMDGTRDDSFYDLLASEARLASFVAIARNDVPVEHWFRLGRTLTGRSRDTTLVSWSGSMFEYLMPLLVMRRFPFTLLDQTYHGAVRRQIAYGRERNVPWGVSESAYNLRDRIGVYQYRAFGVPGLGLKRGLGNDLVIAPYATLLALLVEPRAAMQNLRALERAGALGDFGFRDALDYTRIEGDQQASVIGAFMAHHIGMGLVALTNALQRQIWQRRFHSDPLVRSAELMLHERIPRRLEVHEDQPIARTEEPRRAVADQPDVREIRSADTPQPRVALLGFHPYTMLITNGGGGFSNFEDLAITRWRADGTRDNYGQWCYVRDLTADRVWSATHQPTTVTADYYRADFSTDRAAFVRIDGEIETRTDIAVVPDDSAEVRRITLFNRSQTDREIELTSYGEVVLAPAEAERAHPAFANLFVETEWVPLHSAILASRRQRAATDRKLWLVHVVAVGPEVSQPATFETDRARFIGRGRTTANPAALDPGVSLSGSVGGVLDPIFSLRVRVRVPARGSASVAFTTIVAPTRAAAVEMADRYDDPYAAQRALDLSSTHAQVEIYELGIEPADATLYQQIAGHLLFPHPSMRASQAELQANQLGQAGLWAMGVSGDWPILLAIIDSTDGVPSIRHLLRAHHYWRLKGIHTDLVILNAHAATYLQDLSDRILETVVASSEAGLIDRPGGVFIRRIDILSAEELLLLRATARVHVTCDGIGLGKLLDLPEIVQLAAPPFIPSRLNGAASERARTINQPSSPRAEPRPALAFANPLGGVNAQDEYEIRLHPADETPAPWSNVIANATAGFCVTERGSGFTWAENSYFFRITPWYNDPVTDPLTEVLYLRDDETGEQWCPTPAPLARTSEYVVCHGIGYTTFEHQHEGIDTSLTLAMPEHDPLKITRLRIHNSGSRARRITLTSFVEWSLGVMREHTQHQVTTRFDAALGAILADNSFDAQFADLVAFSALSEPVTTWTGDRREFLGRNGSVHDPAGLRLTELSGITGNGIDPCAVLQCLLALEPGETRDVIVLLGAAHGPQAAADLIQRYRVPSAAGAAVSSAVAHWKARLAVIEIETPLPGLDVMVNDWSLYQTLSCRMWGRSALYQSGGAYGFRDQLQDCMAFVYAEPAIARAHILRATARQFEEGDVQHWWHPQSGRGVRTRFSDDLAWLPYVVEHYVRVTGDVAILDEPVPFLQMRQLEPHEHEVYDLPGVSPQVATVYEHCIRALDRACTAGAHGLPLMGIGDWNDGMSRVGSEGRGESVWLAWFLAATLQRFSAICTRRNDSAAAQRFDQQRTSYVTAAETNAWDGAWYRRAYFDNGEPLGSAQSDEARIDSIAQTWSVISGGGNAERTQTAMRSLAEHLIKDEPRLMLLLTPPFDKTPNDPGYIKGYLPGVRENGAQYTHAALWTVLATAMLGDGDRAVELLQMINPLTRTGDESAVDRYKVEPYVIAADIYSMPQHLARGGWTWYTGSASWFYRVALESILGFAKTGDTLAINPCIPRAWDGFSVRYRFMAATYDINVKNPAHVCRGVAAVSVDGKTIAGTHITLVADAATHTVEVTLG